MGLGLRVGRGFGGGELEDADVLIKMEALGQ